MMSNGFTTKSPGAIDEKYSDVAITDIEGELDIDFHAMRKYCDSTNAGPSKSQEHLEGEIVSEIEGIPGEEDYKEESGVFHNSKTRKLLLCLIALLCVTVGVLGFMLFKANNKFTAMKADNDTYKKAQENFEIELNIKLQKERDSMEKTNEARIKELKKELDKLKEERDSMRQTIEELKNKEEEASHSNAKEKKIILTTCNFGWIISKYFNYAKKSRTKVDSTADIPFEDSIEHQVFMKAIEFGSLPVLKSIRSEMTEPIRELQRLLFIEKALKENNIPTIDFLVNISKTKGMTRSPRSDDVFKSILTKIVDIGAFQSFEKLLDEYRSYILALQDPSGTGIFNAESYEHSLLGGITKQLFERRNFEEVLYLKRYENKLTVGILRNAENKERRLCSAHETNVQNFIRQRTYFELKGLISLNWEVMLDHYLNDVDSDMRTFLLKKASEEEEQGIIRTLFSRFPA